MAKNRSAAKQSQSYLFNFAAIGVGATTVLLAVFGVRSKEVATPCSERYGVATQLSLQRGAGDLLSGAELQARLGGRDWGVAEHASVVKTPAGPRAVALHVNMPKPVSADKPSGLGFTWLMAEAQPARAVCLSYQVMVPKDFQYGESGVLPGIFGGVSATAPKDLPDFVNPSFGTHLQWAKDGRLVMRVATAGEIGAVGYEQVGSEQVAMLERGKWQSIEQEIFLNADGQSNGLLRVWVDGALKLEKSNIVWRMKQTSQLRGVDVRAQYANGSLAPVGAPASTSLQLSPMEVRWHN
jgi:hypothetical protein